MLWRIDSALCRSRLDRLLEKARPRVAIVKQDTQDDLYACRPGSSAAEVIGSSLMRSGPAGLLLAFECDFFIVPAGPEPECAVWQEKATELGWYALDDLWALRDRLPGMSTGQQQFAVKVDDVDWTRYDIVISIDISIPKRIVDRYRKILWCYYIREPKTSAYKRSLAAPLAGYDLFFTQEFRLRRDRSIASHCVHVPYYLQYLGWPTQIFPITGKDEDARRRGFFLEHHTGLDISEQQTRQLEGLGPVHSTANQVAGGGAQFYGRSAMSIAERLRGLQRARYFVQFGKSKRTIFGNGLVEAICAGCIALGDPASHANRDVYSSSTSARNWDELLAQIHALESDAVLYARTLKRQQEIINYTCWNRPLLELMLQWRQKAFQSRARTETASLT